jgi:hypothetical protein
MFARYAAPCRGPLARSLERRQRTYAVDAGKGARANYGHAKHKRGPK